MAVVTIPTGLLVQDFTFGQRRFDLNFQAGDTGAQQSRLLAPPRWMASMASAPEIEAADSAAWRAFIMSLQGRVNVVAVYDVLNTAPRGTARGTWTANGAAAAGATSMAISCGVGQAGATILAGDWIGVNQSATGRQLLHVQADLTLDGSGNGTVTFQSALRVAVANGSSVAWDRPTCLMRVTGNDNSWRSARALQGGFSLDLIESWEGA